MRRAVLLLLLVFVLAVPASALDIQAPEAPEAAQEYMPTNSGSFVEDLLYILKKAMSELNPSIRQAASICLCVIAVALLTSMTSTISDRAGEVSQLVGTISVSTLLISPANALINLGAQTVTEISQYGKLLLPVMSAALAAQGGVSSSGALYIGTAFFNSVLSSCISNLLIPMLYIFLCLCVADSVVGDKLVKELRSFSKWSMSWMLKIILYIFTGYMGITGVVSGTVDASAVKAAKLAISGSVPVVGSILSDASEAVLVSAGTMKNAAGIYGILVILAISVGPFLRVAVQYLIVKVTAAVCSAFGAKKTSELMEGFSTAMGMILAMTGTVCLLQLISTVCFMNGVG